KAKEPVTPPKKVDDAEVSLADKKKVTKPKEEKPKPKEAPTPAKSTKKEMPPPKKSESKPKELSVAEINKLLEKATQRYTGESTDAGGTGFGSAGGGTTKRGGGGGELRPPEFFSYRSTIEYAIKSGWRWHDTAAPLEARVCFEITRAGDIRNVQLCGSSGNREYDDSALRAVHKATPLPPPPESVYQFFQQVRLVFSPTD